MTARWASSRRKPTLVELSSGSESAAWLAAKPFSSALPAAPASTEAREAGGKVSVARAAVMAEAG
jgi:hypothetical protein